MLAYRHGRDCEFRWAVAFALHANQKSACASGEARACRQYISRLTNAKGTLISCIARTAPERE